MSINLASILASCCLFWGFRSTEGCKAALDFLQLLEWSDALLEQYMTLFATLQKRMKPSACIVLSTYPQPLVA